MERRILHLRVISFPVAVYRARDASLRDRPVVVAAGRGARGMVLSASEEARGEGVRPGMTLPEARRWCRGALVLPPDFILLERAGRSIAEILARYSPVVEPAGGGRFFADLTGTSRLLGAAVDVARAAQKEIGRRLSLGPNAGVGVNKLVSGVATRLQRPVSLLDVRPGGEAGFLSPLAVRYLPAVEPRVEGRLLEELNIRRVRELAAVDLPHLSLAFGRNGVALYRQARGIDESPVRPPEKALVIDADETLPQDTNDDALLLGCLYALVERCGARLRRLGRPAGEIRLTARYSDGVVVSRRAALQSPSACDPVLFAHARSLFERVVGRRGRVRYLRVGLARLAPVAVQMSLFDEAAGEEDPDHRPSLIAALDRIRGRFGDRSIAFGRVIGIPPAETHDAA